MNQDVFWQKEKKKRSKIRQTHMVPTLLLPFVLSDSKMFLDCWHC